MNSTDLLTAFRDSLVSAGLVRKAMVAGAESSTGAAPPLHIEPIAPPAPGEREAPENDTTLVVTLRLSSEIGETAYDGYRRRCILDVVYRSKGTGGLKRARALDAAIRSLVYDQRSDYGFGWTIGTTAPVEVLSVEPYTGLSPIARTEGQGSTEIAKYLFEIRA